MRRTGERRVSKLRTVAVALVCCNQVQPCLALAGDGGVCPSPYDTDCNGLVDGADLARVLASWGAPSNTCDFNGDCMVGSADLGQLLAAWGPVVESGQSDAGFFVEGREVSICLGEEIGNITAVIDGYYVPNDSSGFSGGFGGGYGELDVTLNGELLNQISITPSGLVGFGFDCKIAIDGSTDTDTISVNGMDTPISEVVDDAVNDMRKKGGSVFDWDCYTAMMMSMTAVMHMPEMKVVRQNDGPGFWCKTWAIGVASAVTVVLGGGCVAFSGGCALGSTATFGGLTLPCAVWLSLCYGGAYAGVQAAYELALAYCD